MPGAVVVSAVAGTGGVGKTALAQHAAAVAVDRGVVPRRCGDGQPARLTHRMTLVATVAKATRTARHTIAGDLARAMFFYNAGNRTEERRAVRNLANTLEDLGRPGEALSAYRQSLSVYKTGTDRHGEATTSLDLGLLLHHHGRFGEADAAFRHAQALWRDVGDAGSEAQAWHNLGQAMRAARRSKPAIAAYRRALALYEQLDDRDGQRRAWNALGQALTLDNREVEAQQALQQARSVLAE